MFKWGTMTLKVKKDSYIPPYPALSIRELELIPSMDVETPASALQTGGRGRKMARMRLMLTNADYNALYLDHLASSVKVLSLPDEQTMAAALIFTIDPPVKRTGWLECDIQFIEV